MDDEEGNSFSDSSESNRSASSLDLVQKSNSKHEIKNSNDCDDIEPSIAEEKNSSLKLESDNESESPFYRPWLDSSSHKRKSTVPTMSMVPPILSLPINFQETFFSPYYLSLHTPFIAQQNLANYCQYDYPMFRWRRL